MLSYQKFIYIIVHLIVFFGIAMSADAARLSVSPAGGAFVTQGTFDVSIILDTENESINAVRAVLSFPPDKLQLISSGTGRSIIEIWTAHPSSNNATGIIDIQGGIPNGINVKSGLVLTLTFRAKTTGTAFLRFSDDSKVLANDGLGTDVLSDSNNGVYNIVLPPPAGPIVASDTHPDPSHWYSNADLVLRWSSDETDYSYILDRDPVTNPDNISQGPARSVRYNGLSDGTHYFHIKSLRNGTWGGTTHFAVNIDTTPLAEFPIEIQPSSRTSSRQPIINFATTDSASGIDHYELKVIPLKPSAETAHGGILFIEAESPHIMPFELGSYDVLVRAHDAAGNYREITQRLDIVTPLFQIIRGEGIRISDGLTIPWILVWIIIILAIVALSAVAAYVFKWHRRIDRQRISRDLPGHVRKQLDELKKYRSKYGKITYIFFAIAVFSFIFSSHAKADHVQLDPPVVTTVSRNITNEDIFYIGGKSNNLDAEIIIYLQNLHTGETLSDRVPVDKEGEWFYRHSSFLSSGNYYIWVQSQIDEEVSPPSPQIDMNVQGSAIQIGSSRLSREVLYLFVIAVFFVS